MGWPCRRSELHVVRAEEGCLQLDSVCDPHRIKCDKRLWGLLTLPAPQANSTSLRGAYRIRKDIVNVIPRQITR